MQRMGYCAGLTPQEFWDCTLNEVLLMIQGYRLRTRDSQYFQYQLNTPQERQVSVYEFWPLPGDPNAEEQQKMRQEEAEETKKLYEAGQQLGLEWIEQYKQKGMLN